MAGLVVPKVHRPQCTHDGATYSAVGHTRVTWGLLDRTSRHSEKLVLTNPAVKSCSWAFRDRGRCRELPEM
jgi:hypothetical protein